MGSLLPSLLGFQQLRTPSLHASQHQWRVSRQSFHLDMLSCSGVSWLPWVSVLLISLFKFTSQGFLLAASSSSLPLLYLGLGGALGTGGCLASITGVLEINKRFTGTRRGMAHGWSLAGNTLGGLLLPGSMALLFENWGRSGALAIHSAILLNTLPAALFYSGQVVKVEDRGEGRPEGGEGKVLSFLWFCIF